MRIVMVGFVMLVSGRCVAESGCFHSVGEAARRAGVRDEGGYRAEGVRRDVFSGAQWVRVARCGKPESPTVLVQVAAAQSVEAAPAGAVAMPSARPAVVAGDAVRLVWEEGSARGELSAVAAASGAIGARVRVRLNGFATAQGRLVAGVVRAAGVVEMVPGLEVAQ